MEQEKFITGYCRALDGSRVVEVILENGQVTEVDCAFPNCVHSQSCEIAKEIKKSTVVEARSVRKCASTKFALSGK